MDTLSNETATLPDRYLTPKEAAEYTGYSVNTLYEYAKAGVVPHRRRGKALRFLMSELDSWVSGEWAPEVA